MFRDIIEQGEILDVLREYMRASTFVPTIFQKPGEKWNEWTVTPGGHIIEGRSVLGIAHDSNAPEQTVITLTSSDVGNCRPVGTLRLGGISKVQVLY